MTTVEDLRDWYVTFVMIAGSARREFTMTIPAPSHEFAEKATFGLAYAINEGSGYVWKIGPTVSIREAN